MAKYPDSILVKVNYAKMLVAGGRGQEGREILEKTATENPDDINLQMILAQVYQQLERFDLALMTLEQVKKQFPDSPLPYLSLAQMSLQKKQPENALKILKEAETSGIQDSGLYRLYAMVSHRQGDSETALNYFEKAVDVASKERVQLNKMILVDYHSYLKNYKEAQEILESIIAEDETKKTLKSKVVELFLAQGEFEQARTSVDALLEENAGDARGHFLKGLMMMKEKEVVGAREQFSKAKELAPNAAENQFMYGLTFMNESQDISITEISEALKKNPELIKARMALAELFAKKGDYQASLEELDKIIEKLPEDYKVRALRISVLLRLKQPQAALEDAKLLVEKEPDVLWHTFRLAEIYFFTKEYDKALPLYLELQKNKPESGQLLNRIVGIYMLKNEQDRAMDVVDSFLIQFPENSQAVMVKAKIYLSQGYLDLAENVLLPASEASSDVAILTMLAELYKAKNDTGKAVLYYEKALAIAPKDIAIMMKIADFHLNDRKYQEAIRYYEMVLEKEKEFLPAMNNLAYLYGESGEKLDRALALALSVSQKLPDNPDVADTLGWIYVTTKDYPKAEQSLEKAFAAKPESAVIMYHLGVLRFQQRLMKDAQALLKDAIAKGLTEKELSNANTILADINKFYSRLLLAQKAKEQGELVKAAGLYEEIINSDGFIGEVAAELAVLYAEQGQNMAKALELAQKAYDEKSVDARRADALGWVFYHQGSLLMAKKYIEEAIAADGGYGSAYMHLGAIYMKKDDVIAAQKAFEKAAEAGLSSAEQKQLDALKPGL